MKPILVLQHEATQGPGVLLDHLDSNGLPYRLLMSPLEGWTPASARDYSGIIVLGSDHSVNDDLPWIAREHALLQDAVQRYIPVLGHCFGAQLLARSLGATVQRNPYPNIGWGQVWSSPYAQRVMGLPRRAVLFNWHYDTFQIPSGASRTLYGPHCLNKGFCLGPHWAFQGHLEVTADSIRQWCDYGHQELKQVYGPAAQDAEHILSGLDQHLSTLHLIARQTYQRWTDQLLERAGAVRAQIHMPSLYAGQ
ncbi:type 1 glutamine amidotransferase [Alcaligenes faecalis]|uniref:type 1 glutamine amidotransferase n=1 Tax=Alcaligenes faecalis TaxID=511 RepID=UPI001C829843|nr:type 1 glutamine amidotransferase [Alcaligenes faecalis]MBX6965845.1 type 1 glutamine amidotransferase [Providencia rettgeri]MBX7031351.1 type 1 glutamine amidotransferase [Alcaligenes faecalis]